MMESQRAVVFFNEFVTAVSKKKYLSVIDVYLDENLFWVDTANGLKAKGIAEFHKINPQLVVFPPFPEDGDVQSLSPDCVSLMYGDEIRTFTITIHKVQGEWKIALVHISLALAKAAERRSIMDGIPGGIAI